MEESSYKRIVVTGGCGFIGSHFVKTILKNPVAEVINIDVLTYAGNPENLNDLTDDERNRYTHKQMDVCDQENVAKIVKEFVPDAIVHFAAESHVDRSYFGVQDFIRTNIEGTRVIVEAARSLQETPRFLHVSTDEVYGDIPEGEYSTEDSSFRPSNLYAASKAGADLLVQSYIRTHALPALIVRGSNNYGTYQYPEKLIPMTATRLLNGGTVSLHGDGRHRRSWLHVNDFCDAIELVLNKAPEGEVYNVSGEIKSNLEVLELIADILNVPLSDRLEYVNDRPGADFRYAPSADKLKQKLDWSPKRSFDTEIAQILDWYDQNRSWWLRILETDQFNSHIERQTKGQWF